MKNHIVIVLLFCYSLTLNAQKGKYLSGYLTDESSGEVLIGASVFTEDNTSGTTTNEYGFYNLQLPSGKTKVHFSYVGFEEAIKIIDIRSDTIVNIELNNSVLTEVTVIAKKNEIASNGLNRLQMPIEQLARLPSIGGETDILKTLALLPGISTGQEGSANLYIRGGTPDQNLILLDGIPVYNASHIGGFFSVFNADAINNIEVMRGGIPASYGGRLSSVIDITMREGNEKEFKGSVGGGLLTSHLTLEGPVKKGKSNFLFASRVSYLGLVNVFTDRRKADDYFDYWLYDINVKTNYRLKKGQLYLSAYTSNDIGYVVSNDFYYLADTLNAKYESNSIIQWGNTTFSSRYVVPLSSKIFAKFLLGYTQYSYGLEHNAVSTDYTPLGELTLEDNYTNGSKVKDWIGRADFDYNIHPRHYLSFGIAATHHRFNTNSITPRLASNEIATDTTELNVISTDFLSFEYAIYIQDKIKWTDKLSSQIGLRWDFFQTNGELYNNVQPRASLEYQLSPTIGFSSSFSLTKQYIHLLQNNGFGLPNDIWVPATDNTLPQQAYQMTFGASFKLSKTLNLVTEAYYKKMNHLIDYKEGLNEEVYNEIGDWEKLVETNGEGTAYGVEWLLQKEKGKFKGYLAYTLSWNNRKFENINNGNSYPFTYDRRHDIAFFFQYQLSKKWIVSGNWVFNTGTAVTLPVASVPFPVTGSEVSDFSNLNGGTTGENPRFYSAHFIFDGKNNNRLPNYHRMDVGLEHKRITKRNNFIFWKFSVYNLYNRKNPSYLEVKGGGTSYTTINGVTTSKQFRSKVVQKSLFSFIPGISMEYKF